MWVSVKLWPLYTYSNNLGLTARSIYNVYNTLFARSSFFSPLTLLFHSLKLKLCPLAHYQSPLPWLHPLNSPYFAVEVVEVSQQRWGSGWCHQQGVPSRCGARSLITRKLWSSWRKICWMVLGIASVFTSSAVWIFAPQHESSSHLHPLLLHQLLQRRIVTWLHLATMRMMTIWQVKRQPVKIMVICQCVDTPACFTWISIESSQPWGDYECNCYYPPRTCAARGKVIVLVT